LPHRRVRADYKAGLVLILELDFQFSAPAFNLEFILIAQLKQTLAQAFKCRVAFLLKFLFVHHGGFRLLLLRARDQESATLERAVVLVNHSEQSLDFLFQISLIRKADITLLNLAIARNHDGGGESDQPSELLG